MPGGEENLKVAVRVRPFNDRENTRNATLIIEMGGNSTEIKDPAQMGAKGKTFTFDYSYWSHDGFKDRGDGYLEAENEKYADQKQVFDDLGRGVLDNSWKGYNCSLFAYGQTGSGKSYSMVGYGVNKGVIPIACETLFDQISEKTAEGGEMEYQVTASMLEIYCEKVRDLLDSHGHSKKGGLKVREHAKKGFYVEGLIQSPVDSYKAIEAKLDEGTKNRTVAATSMNATSSRAHTIFQINFTQNDTKAKTSKTSIINLVDLAGSERQKDTGAEGDRLKEGIVINQSLSTLGRCIKALADSQKKGKGKIQVPFRDSVLTSLLKNALGGNSKTIMIAAISPADINYDESLSTLRFADRAKAIKTQAVVNESATDRLIRELREENNKLQQQLKAGGVVSTNVAITDNDELEALRAQLAANQQEMTDREKTWKERIADENVRTAETTKDAELSTAKRKTAPHFWNLNEDPALTSMVVHFVEKGDSRIGNGKANPPAEIVLNGLSIQKEHARTRNDSDKTIILVPMSGARILVNGQECAKERELHHNDRVHFGGNHLYVMYHPSELAQKMQRNERVFVVNYEMAQAEIAESMGIMGSRSGPRSKEDMILEEDLIKTLPMIAQANAMSDELKKYVMFECVLVAPQARGLKTGPTEIMVKMHNRSNENEFMWDKNKFINRYYGMQELYQNYSDGFANWDVPKERDPFYESPDTEVRIGNVHAYLQSLAYMVEIDEQLPVTDFKGNERGYVKLDVLPCTVHGKELVGEFVESPDELIGRNLNFKIKISNAMGLPRKFVSSRCRYKFFGQDKDAVTMEVSGSNPMYGHEKLFTYTAITKQMIEYLKDSALIVEVYGKQHDKKVGGAKIPMGSLGSSDYKEKCEHLENKLERVNRLLEDAGDSGTKTVSVKALTKALKDDGDDVPNGDIEHSEDQAAEDTGDQDGDDGEEKKKKKPRDGSKKRKGSKNRSGSKSRS